MVKYVDLLEFDSTPYTWVQTAFGAGVHASALLNMQTTIQGFCETDLGIPTAYDNSPKFNPGASVDGLHAAFHLASVRFRLIKTGASQGWIATATWKLTLSAPKLLGTGPAHTAMHSIAEALRGAIVGSVTWRDPSLEPTPPDSGDSSWWSLTASFVGEYAFTRLRELPAAPTATSSLSDVAKTVRTYWDSQIATPESLPTEHDNAPFTVPFEAPWARLSVDFGINPRTELGAHWSRLRGSAIAQVFVPRGDGLGYVLQVFGAVVDNFIHVKQDQVSFLSPSFVGVGARDGWWQTNFHLPFRADQGT
jgi:hypothetical protein